jgi:CheY-like chemotaxis protein
LTVDTVDRWSIVNQLGGKIHIRSELGKGTDVEVTIPLDTSESSEGTSTDPGDLTKSYVDAQKCVASLRQRATGKSVSISRSAPKCGSAHLDALPWDCVERYCQEWFGFEIKSAGADIVITDGCDATKYPDEQRILIYSGLPCSSKQEKSHGNRPIGNISTPIGPFKLARSILALLDMDILPSKGAFSLNKSDAGTQTPLGSTEERRVMNGIILTDYGFPPQGLPEDSPSETPENNDTPKPEQDQLPVQIKTEIPPLSPPTPRLTPDQPPLSTSSSRSAVFPFPFLATSNLTLPSRAKTEHTPAKTGLHILAVDDNTLNLQLLHRYLQKRTGDKIVTARNGLEAVDAFRSSLASQKRGFDVIFMDISMPEMDGFEATRLIRGLESRSCSKDEIDVVVRDIGGGQEGGKERGRAYIVALTGLASRRDRDEAERSEFDDFLTKPVSFARIGEVLGRVGKKGRDGDGG